MQIQRERDELALLARRDPLTGLGNRRNFDEALGSAHGRARRQGVGLAVLMIDIDHFKRLNDTYGHPEGDRRLQAVAAILDGCLQRGDDLLARYGGESSSPLPAPDIGHALGLGERLRAAVEAAALPAAQAHVTISIGVAWQAAHDEGDPRSLVERADQALYRANMPAATAARRPGRRGRGTTRRPPRLTARSTAAPCRCPAPPCTRKLATVCSSCADCSSMLRAAAKLPRPARRSAGCPGRSDRRHGSSAGCRRSAAARPC